MQHQKQPIETVEIGKTTIGFNRYQFLKSLASEDLTPEEVKQIENYEQKHTVTQEQKDYKQRYIDKITTIQETESPTISKKQLWDLFQIKFFEIYAKQFIQTPETLANIKPIMLYFLKDSNFFNCDNLSKLSEPSFDKGLMIIGNFGNGKTATMTTIEAVFKTFKGYSFKGYSANEVVEMYEQCGDDDSKSEFDRKINRGVRYFDDVKTERIASNYGKVNLFKDIFEIREKANLITHITCNFKDGYPNDIQSALDEFEEKYGSRVYDRLFKMFNIIEFKGKSFRK